MAFETSLAVGIDARGARLGAAQAKSAFNTVKGAARGAANEFQSLKNDLFSLKGAIAGLGLGILIREIVQTSSQFEQFRLQLQTVVGSMELANREFERIKTFAASTPFEVSNLTESFIRLQAAGIAPTEDRLKSFGDTAAAFGRDITQFADAVVGAITGEGERLKQFGIITRFEQDQVRFIFQGTERAVKRDAESIVEALTSIGQTAFAGAMERQANSAAGAFSNLQDSVDSFFDAIGQSGVLDTLTSGIRILTEAVEIARTVFAPTLVEQLDRVEARIKTIEETSNGLIGTIRSITAPGILEDARNFRSDLLRQLDIQRKSEDALAVATANSNDKQQEAAAITKAHAAELKKLATEINRTMKAAESAAEEGIKPFLERQEEARKVIEATRTPLEAYNDEVARLTELHNEAAIGTETFERAVREAKDRLEDATTETSRLVKTTQESNSVLTGVFEEVGRSIQRNLGDTFNELLSGNIKSVGDFARSFLGIIRNMLAQAAAAFASQRFVLPAVGLSGSPAGASGAAAGGGGGAGGGFPGISNFGNLFGTTNAAGNSVNGLVSFGGGIASLFGAGGTGGGAAAAGVAPVAGGLTNAGTAGLSSAALGAIGGAASFGIGAAASALASGGNVGQAIFAGAGTAIGSIFGPVGGAIGGFLGNTIGGLVFSGNTPKPRAASEIGFDEFGRPTILQVGTQEGGDADAGRKLGQATVDALTGFADVTGGTFSGDSFGDFAAIQVKQSNSGTKFRLKDDLSKAGDLLSFKTAEEAISRFVVETVEKGLLGGINENTVRILNERGLQAAVQFEQSRVAFNQQIDDTINGPFQATLDALSRAEENAIKQAEEFGVSSRKVRQAFDIQFGAVGQDIAGRGAGFFGSLANPLQSFLTGAQLSDLNPGGLQDRLGFARDEFERLSSSARGGDLTSIASLSQAGDILLQLERQFNASGPGFATAFEDVTSTVETALSQVEDAQRQFNADLVTANIQAVNDQTRTLQSELQELRKEVALLRQAERQR